MGKPSNYTSKRGNNFKIEGGVYTGYTYVNKNTGEKSNGAFDNKSEAMSDIEKEETFTNYQKENW